MSCGDRLTTTRLTFPFVLGFFAYSCVSSLASSVSRHVGTEASTYLASAADALAFDANTSTSLLTWRAPSEKSRDFARVCAAISFWSAAYPLQLLMPCAAFASCAVDAEADGLPVKPAGKSAATTTPA